MSFGERERHCRMSTVRKEVESGMERPLANRRRCMKTWLGGVSVWKWRGGKGGDGPLGGGE